jgi:ubiquinone/menaquinone biosynthesis C-methylase UbiE
MAAERFNGTAPARVLDIGCGTGRLLRRAALRWPSAHFIGVDPAEGMIRKARLLTPGMELHVGQGEEIPLPDSSIDVAFSTISFHHWEDQAAGVREVARVLRTGGWFCLADGVIPAGASSLIPHTRIHTRKEMAALFRQAGLRVAVQRSLMAGTVMATVGRKG